MSSIIFFFFFIPSLAFILLGVNIFAPHNPYLEKNNVFECGFSSFLGQNRTQFSVSFFIFALLFLLFDLEILLVYPYLVSAYTNGIYGLTVLLFFLLALTLGFAFELGKKALSIDSRQMSNASTNISNYVSIVAYNRHLFFNSKRLYSTYNSKRDEFEILKFIISFISSIRFLVCLVKSIKSPIAYISGILFSCMENIVCGAFVSNPPYLYFKNLYNEKGSIGLLSELVIFMYSTTIGLKSYDILKILFFHIVCIYGILYLNLYLYLIVLSVSAVLLLPFIISTLLVYIFDDTFKREHPFFHKLCVFLCITLIVIFICLLFLLIVKILPEIIELLESFLLAKGNNSGGKSSGPNPGSGPGPGPEHGSGPGGGPGDRGPGGGGPNDSPLKRKRRPSYTSDSEGDSDTPNYPDGSPEQNRIDEELLRTGEIKRLRRDTDSNYVYTPEVQRVRDEQRPRDPPTFPNNSANTTTTTIEVYHTLSVNETKRARNNAKYLRHRMNKLGY